MDKEEKVAPTVAPETTKPPVTIRQRKRLLIIFFVVIAALALAAAGGRGAYEQYKRKQAENASRQKAASCPDEFLSQAGPYLSSRDHANREKLRPIALKIEQTQGYDKNPNCLYVVLTYYMQYGDAEKSRTHLDKLEKVYDTEAGFSQLLGPTKTIEELRKFNDFLQRRAEQIKNNSKSTTEKR